jgi:hypothetical protein
LDQALGGRLARQGSILGADSWVGQKGGNLRAFFGTAWDYTWTPRRALAECWLKRAYGKATLK